MTLATWIPALITLLVLPVGLIEEAFAVGAGIYGLYFVLPAVVAWALDAGRHRLPLLVQRILGALVLLVAIAAIGFWLLWFPPLLAIGLPAVAVVLAVGCRLLRAQSP